MNSRNCHYSITINKTVITMQHLEDAQHKIKITSRRYGRANVMLAITIKNHFQMKFAFD